MLKWPKNNCVLLGNLWSGPCHLLLRGKIDNPNQLPPDGVNFRSRSPQALSIKYHQPGQFRVKVTDWKIFLLLWAAGEKSSIPPLKWEEVTDYPRPSALALSEPLFASHCLFVCRQIHRAKRRCSFVGEQIRRRRVNRPFLRLNLTTLLGAESAQLFHINNKLKTW